ncbi:hypothetical protein P0W64_13500 [Tsukamurella sp. 8F]|uniref:hypothetical protein n=1 Tax=unclassified Tsukamurella TaxID=2633480 RepID=UPI0023B925DA|nr:MULTISPECIES: hypothetical protein [unclassified Tsukamurella]MDF0530391.1 hypothetical protein [Tsukamurella sp. 8J]MDF0587788.1 hypothetical protein [Tsukamurella sp. 8F]
MTTRTIKALATGVAVWVAATALLIVLGDTLVPAAGTLPVPLFVVAAAVAACVGAWQLSILFQRAHDTTLTTRLLFGVCVTGIGLLLDGILIGAFGAHYPRLDQARQGVLSTGLYVAYAGLLAGALIPAQRSHTE